MTARAPALALALAASTLGCGGPSRAPGTPRPVWACHQRSASYQVTGHISGNELGVQFDCATPLGPRITRWKLEPNGTRVEDAHALTPGEFDQLWSGVDGTGWRNLKNCTAGGAKTDPLYTFDIADDVDHRGFSCRARTMPYPYNDLVDPLDLAASQGRSQLGGEPVNDTAAVVTGASRGIGRAIAHALAVAGAAVALWARDRDQLAVVAAEIAAAGGRAQAFVVDVTDSAAVDRAATATIAALPPVTIIVNNAGGVMRKAAGELSDAEWRAMLAVNLDSAFYVTRALLPQLTRAGGRIINIASIAGREGTAMLTAYCAAKHGVVGWTRALAEELRAARVAVNAVCPGSVDTAMLRQGIPDARPDMTPDEIARTVLFLARDAPLALTGSCIDVFG